MDEMPVVREAIGAGILAHGRDDDAVAEEDVANLQFIEQVHDRLDEVCDEKVAAVAECPRCRCPQERGAREFQGLKSLG